MPDISGNCLKFHSQVQLLLGKAYSAWGHISDAVNVYDQLILSHPNDFRGYLAKVFIHLCSDYMTHYSILTIISLGR